MSEFVFEIVTENWGRITIEADTIEEAREFAESTVPMEWDESDEELKELKLVRYTPNKSCVKEDK